MWVLSFPMAQRLEVLHVVLLRQVAKLKSKRLRDGLWRKAVAKKVLQEDETQLLQTYLESRKEIVAEWVALRPTFDVYMR